MDVALPLPVLVGLIAVALAFDFLIGLHDAANSIATIVSTRVLRPQYAVFWAAFFNFIAFLYFGLHVANTLGTGIIDAAAVDARVVFGALMGAIIWNLITWAVGIPRKASNLGDDPKKPSIVARRRIMLPMCNLILTHKIDLDSFANRCCKLQRIPVRQSNTPVRFGLADLIRIRRAVNTIAFC
jgi:hypothetical protein